MAKPKIEDVTLSITPEELISYFTKILEPSEAKEQQGYKCVFCQSNEWNIQPSPVDPSRPMIVSQPIPKSKNLASWYFPVGCHKCGYTMFFDAAAVTHEIEIQRGKEEEND
ncbi:hypothetical protein [Pantoea agglomerans]|uniref:hypothetical protein n=1 Tax=Enterobacter agglomerans TaxID=549 RepID=UPI002543CBAE|nr:hypothetical protein [Pantoea agglomerans]MDK4215922.1 hypothetical protein [Pantoea agglomerans]